MGQTYFKVTSVEQIIDKLNNGCRIVKNQTKHIVLGTNERGYIPVNLREELFKRYPTLDPDYEDTSTHIPLLAAPSSVQESLPPSFPPAPEEYILHELPLRVIESIAILEGLHHIEDEHRHELAFSQVHNKDYKPNDKNRTTAHTLLSLADVTIYYLIDCYHNYRGMGREISQLELELAGLYRMNRQLQQRCSMYEAELIKKTLVVMR